jgi:aminoglycoside phosphotransferase (APT) family kinase protein
MGTPAAEVEIDERQARQLLAAQHPDLADLPIVSIASGWDNHLLRLGDSLVLRFPRPFASALRNFNIPGRGA